MEKIEIHFTPDAIDYLHKLVGILFDKNYFSFEEYAQLYVQQIYNFIEFELKNFPLRKTPKVLQELGSYYAFYKANNRTTWYIFFEKRDSRVLITHISNNHQEEISHVNV